ncbi:MAG TPA: hypothetical protein VGA62_05260 [Acidimicrobiia bacterium]
MTTTDQDLFRELIEELRLADPRVEEGTIMGGRCARVAGEFLALVDFKGSGLVVKLPNERVDALIARGRGPTVRAGREGLQRTGYRFPNATAACGERSSKKVSLS